MSESPRRIMWNGNVRSLPFAEQVAATAAAGFSELSVTPLDWAHWVSDGLSSGDMRTVSADAGVMLTHLDPLARWVDPWEPQNLDPAKYPLGFFGFDVDDFLRIGDALRTSSFTAIVTASKGAHSMDLLTERFAELCQRAMDHGMVCELEFIPLGWGVPDLATAWQIVRDADQPNSGIVFDFWHFVRSGSTLEDLRAVPGDKITSIQVCDGEARLPDGRDPADDCLLFRRPPGHGDFPVSDIFVTLAEIDATAKIGPEIFSAEFDAKDALSIARVCETTLAEVVPSRLGRRSPGG